MYISAVSNGKNIINVWERQSPTNRIKKCYPIEYSCYIEDPDGEHLSMYGDHLTKLEFSSRTEMKDHIDSLKIRNPSVKIFESDLRSEAACLSKYYYKADIPNINFTFIDIEVFYTTSRGFSKVENPYGEINSVSLYHSWLDKYVLICFPSPSYNGTRDPKKIVEMMNEIERLPDNKIDVYIVKNEYELLSLLCDEIENTDILSGWYSESFDIPYIGKRLEKIGRLNSLCFDGAKSASFYEDTFNDKTKTKLRISGRVSLDYLDLFQKFDVVERASYKLEKISEEFLPDLVKMSYDKNKGNNLSKIYEDDFIWYIRYNLRDVEILAGLERKLGYIALANQMCHMTTSQFPDVLGTISLVENAIVNYCHHDLNVIVNDKPKITEGDRIKGAYVLDPQIGMHDNIGAIDIKSLYPSSIRSINISPETRIGQFRSKEMAVDLIAQESSEDLIVDLEEGNTVSLSAKEWRRFLLKNKMAISGYGTIYSQSVKGIMPTILENWFNMRKEFQKKKDTASNKDEASYFNRVQGVYKVLLNSSYGALVNKFFRFYNLADGESTTGTGRMILLHQCSKVNECLNGNYSPFDKNVLYGDTDSTYFKMPADDIGHAIEIADAVAKVVNDSYSKFMRDTFLCTPEFDSNISCSREIVASRGIFAAKKKYILRVVDKEGKSTDELKIMGLELKTTVLPKSISKRLSDFIMRLLKGEPWSDIISDVIDFKNCLELTDDIIMLGLPMGINGLEEYTNLAEESRYSNVNNSVMREFSDMNDISLSGKNPGHVSASMLWNARCDNEDDKITSGTKVKVYYLQYLVNGYKSIAVPADIEYLPDWFINEFVPIIDRSAQISRLVDNPLEHIINPVGYKSPTKRDILVEEMIGIDSSRLDSKVTTSKKKSQTSQKIIDNLLEF